MRQKPALHTAQFASRSRQRHVPSVQAAFAAGTRNQACSGQRLPTTCLLCIRLSMFIYRCVPFEEIAFSKVCPLSSLCRGVPEIQINARHLSGASPPTPSSRVPSECRLHDPASSPSVPVSPVQTGPLSAVPRPLYRGMRAPLLSSTEWLCHILKNTDLHTCLQSKPQGGDQALSSWEAHFPAKQPLDRKSSWWQSASVEYFVPIHLKGFQQLLSSSPNNNPTR